MAAAIGFDSTPKHQIDRDADTDTVPFEFVRIFNYKYDSEIPLEMRRKTTGSCVWTETTLKISHVRLVHFYSTVGTIAHILLRARA